MASLKYFQIDTPEECRKGPKVSGDVIHEIDFCCLPFSILCFTRHSTFFRSARNGGKRVNGNGLWFYSHETELFLLSLMQYGDSTRFMKNFNSAMKVVVQRNGEKVSSILTMSKFTIRSLIQARIHQECCKSSLKLNRHPPCSN